MHDVSRKACIGFGVLAVVFAAPACSHEDTTDELVGSANLALKSIPPEVLCLQVAVTGPTRIETRSFSVEPGQTSQSFRLDALPIGNDRFLGAAFPLACADVDASTVPNWVSAPLDAAVLSGAVTQVTLVMKRNGLSNLGVDFADDELCSADGQPCGAASDCCSKACDSGICAAATACSEASLVDFALNPSCSGFPSPAESDAGWGGGSYRCDLVDGAHGYPTWARGLAFTGGHQDASGGPPYIEPAGERHAVIDLGAERTFQKVVMWWHGAEHTPDLFSLERWDGNAWIAIGDAERLYGARHADGQDGGFSDSDSYTFAPVTARKVRYTFDNSGNNILGTYNIHGWLYSMEVFGCPTE